MGGSARAVPSTAMTPQVSSRPGMNSSMRSSPPSSGLPPGAAQGRCPSACAASRRNSSSDRAMTTPTLDPSRFGFSTQGRGNAARAEDITAPQSGRLRPPRRLRPHREVAGGGDAGRTEEVLRDPLVHGHRRRPHLGPRERNLEEREEPLDGPVLPPGAVERDEDGIGGIGPQSAERLLRRQSLPREPVGGRRGKAVSQASRRDHPPPVRPDEDRLHPVVLGGEAPGDRLPALERDLPLGALASHEDGHPARSRGRRGGREGGHHRRFSSSLSLRDGRPAPSGAAPSRSQVLRSIMNRLISRKRSRWASSMGMRSITAKAPSMRRRASPCANSRAPIFR